MKPMITRQDAINLIDMLDYDDEMLSLCQKQIPQYYAIYEKLITLSESEQPDLTTEEPKQ